MSCHLSCQICFWGTFPPVPGAKVPILIPAATQAARSQEGSSRGRALS